MTKEVRAKIEALFELKGLRMTRPREVILDAAFSDQGDHFTADELFEKARGIDPKASRATLYRTISLLVEGALLHEIDLGKGVASYDPNFIDSPNHNHLICLDCNRVVEFQDSHIEVLEDCIARRLGFITASKSTQIKARCSELQRTGSCASRG